MKIKQKKRRPILIEIFFKFRHHLLNILQIKYREFMQKERLFIDLKDIRGRKYGSNAVVDVVIFVDSAFIGVAHDISERVEEVLINERDVFEVHVHVELKIKN